MQRPWASTTSDNLTVIPHRIAPSARSGATAFNDRRCDDPVPNQVIDVDSDNA